MLCCHAGCSFAEIVAALRGESSDGQRFRSDPERRARASAKARKNLVYTKVGAPYLFVAVDGHRLQKQRYDIHDPDEPDKVFRRTFRWWWDTTGNGTWSPGDGGHIPKLYRPGVATGYATTPGTPLHVVEGERDADNLAAVGIPAVSVAYGANKDPKRVKWLDAWTAELHDVDDLALIADDDEAGHVHARGVARLLHADRPYRTVPVNLCAPGCNDVSDHLAAGCTREQLRSGRATGADLARRRAHSVPALARSGLRPAGARRRAGRRRGRTTRRRPGVAARGVRFRQRQARDRIRATGAQATVTSTITSEGALLSATAKRQQTKDATGGLLAKLGARGLLVVKDFTSIISMNREVRTGVLVALREVYDGKWERNVGADGGRTLTWLGRLVIIGATTTAYDTASGVISAMGDRFALVRIDSTLNRIESGRSALRNVSHEKQMRSELAEATGGLLTHLDSARAVLDAEAMDIMLNAANLVTLARTAVERDHRGDVVDAHAPEMPTRFAKMLGQVARGAQALGMNREHAVGLALRVAADSIPPLRLTVLRDVATNPTAARTTDVARRVKRPRTTVDRTLAELVVLGLVVHTTTSGGPGWEHKLAEGISIDVLDPALADSSVPRKVSTGEYGEKEEKPNGPENRRVRLLPDESGDPAARCRTCKEPLLLFLTAPGRDQCEHCRLAEQREATA